MSALPIREDSLPAETYRSLEESCLTLHYAAGNVDDSPLQPQQVYTATLRYVPVLLPAEDGRRRRPPAGPALKL
jgi:hypothetical protein